VNRLSVIHVFLKTKQCASLVGIMANQVHETATSTTAMTTEQTTKGQHRCAVTIQPNARPEDK